MCEQNFAYDFLSMTIFFTFFCGACIFASFAGEQLNRQAFGSRQCLALDNVPDEPITSHFRICDSKSSKRRKNWEHIRPCALVNDMSCVLAKTKPVIFHVVCQFAKTCNEIQKLNDQLIYAPYVYIVYAQLRNVLTGRVTCPCVWTRERARARACVCIVPRGGIERTHLQIGLESNSNEFAILGIATHKLLVNM